MSKMIASAQVGETLNPQIVALAKLGLTDAEIEQVLADDKRIDKGAKLFEQTPEQKKASKQATKADSKPRNKPVARERKTDDDKRHLMRIIETAVKYNPDCEAYEATNPEREAVFHFKGRKYKIVLSCPRG